MLLLCCSFKSDSGTSYGGTGDKVTSDIKISLLKGLGARRAFQINIFTQSTVFYLNYLKSKVILLTPQGSKRVNG